MKLSSEALTAFKKIFEEEHGVVLTDEQAQSRAIRLLRLVKMIYKPIIKRT